MVALYALMVFVFWRLRIAWRGLPACARSRASTAGRRHLLRRRRPSRARRRAKREARLFLRRNVVTTRAPCRRSVNVQPDLQMATRPCSSPGSEGREEGSYSSSAKGRVVDDRRTKGRELIVRQLFGAIPTGSAPDRRTLGWWWPEFGVDVGPRTSRYPDVVVDLPGAGLASDCEGPRPHRRSPLAVLGDARPRRQGRRVFPRRPSLDAYLVLAQDEVKAGSISAARAISRSDAGHAGARMRRHQYSCAWYRCSLADIYAGIEFD